MSPSIKDSIPFQYSIFKQYPFCFLKFQPPLYHPAPPFLLGKDKENRSLLPSHNPLCVCVKSSLIPLYP